MRQLGIKIWGVIFLCSVAGKSFFVPGGILLALAIAVYTVVFVLALLIRAIFSRKLSHLYPVPFMALAIALSFSTPIRLISPYLRLFVEYRSYDKAIEMAVAGDDSLCRKLHCIIENTNLRQVAFVWDGITDNWFGICHDPTGVVMNSNLLKHDWSNRNDPEYSKASRMFDGDMIGADHLWGSWYACSFT